MERPLKIGDFSFPYAPGCICRARGTSVLCTSERCAPVLAQKYSEPDEASTGSVKTLCLWLQYLFSHVLWFFYLVLKRKRNSKKYFYFYKRRERFPSGQSYALIAGANSKMVWTLLSWDQGEIKETAGHLCILLINTCGPKRRRNQNQNKEIRRAFSVCRSPISFYLFCRNTWNRDIGSMQLFLLPQLYLVCLFVRCLGVWGRGGYHLHFLTSSRSSGCEWWLYLTLLVLSGTSFLSSLFCSPLHLRVCFLTYTSLPCAHADWQ